MCGIAGIVGSGDAQAARDAVAAMCGHMRPRGPDDEGIEVLQQAAPLVVLGARRLAIIDPSPSGHQPMRDRDRGTTIVFNGMIYNFRELRRELEAAGERFTSGCDTEVVLRAYGRWGADAVARLRGMFAFAIWDERTQQLFIARDRLGIKPLYHAHVDGRFTFASQVKTLVAAGVVEPRLSSEGLASFLAYGAVSEPRTIVEGVQAVPAAHTGCVSDGTLTTERYWEPAPPLSEGGPDPAAELRELLARTVEGHLVSDAPIGVFLSGGLDSSLLAALAARTAADVRTVSIEFAESELTERRFVGAVARHIGSTHTSLELTSQQLLAWLSDGFAAMDQPSFDGMNTFAVARSASQAGLKVAVSGLGADELFDGYGYVRRARALERLASLPRTAGRLVPRLMCGEPGRRAKLAYWVDTPPRRRDAHRLLRRLFLPDEVARLTARVGAVAEGDEWPADGDLYRRLSIRDLELYTRNVLLRDTDCMSMANSLEVRVPYLDHELVDHALALPARVKGERKRLLRSAAGGLLPEEVLERRKHGFLLPLDDWMRGRYASEVGDVVQELPPTVADHVDPAVARDVWRAYEVGRTSWLRPWALYSLARWEESLP